MYFFLSIISLVGSACLASEPGDVTNVTDLDGNDPLVKFAVKVINEDYKSRGDNATRTFLNIVSAYKKVCSPDPPEQR
jgi:hypothetical protein